MRIVIALGGNALLQRGEPLEIAVQRHNVERAALAIAQLVREGHEVILTHGNGPQVGLLALQAEAYSAVSAYPFDVLDAESQSLIGYMLQQALGNALPEREVVTLITQTLVEEEDPAFLNPTKFVGPCYTQEEANALAKARGWAIKADHKDFRRVIASPLPRAIVELNSIQLLVAHGVIVICAGGGGIPVIRHEGSLQGVEAVIDKDRTSALLAKELKADCLIILTDVAGIFENFEAGDRQPISTVEVETLRKRQFPAGSMGPKVEAVCEFVTSTGARAAIGHLTALSDIVKGTAGTQIMNKEIHHGH